MMLDEMYFVEQLSYNVAVKKRFFIAFDFVPKSFDRTYTFDDVQRYFENEEYKARRYLSQCGLDVIETSDNAFLTDLFFTIINKNSAKALKPGRITDMYGEIHEFTGNVQ